jgi:hypothetical protein
VNRPVLELECLFDDDEQAHRNAILSQSVDETGR